MSGIKPVSICTQKILIVDDDQAINDLIKLYLENDGFHIITAYEGHTVIPLVKSEKPDLILLDMMLPDMDGLELCREIRRFSDVPILFVSSKDDESDKIIGLLGGGDDYITKPFSPRELAARVQVHLRRSQSYQGESTDHEFRYPGLEVNLLDRTVHVKGKLVFLSTKEFDLLALLVRNPHRTFEVEEMFEIVWGESSLGDTRTLMVHISNLRKKIEDEPAKPKYIITIRGVGYKFLPPTN